MTTDPGKSDVSIVIPNWNGEPHLRECLDSISGQTLQPAETIVVDNGSTDRSVPIITAGYPWVSVVLYPKKAGVAAAMNMGIRASRGSFIVLLNNDTQLDPRWIATMIKIFSVHPDVGSAGCRMLNFFERSLFDAAGDILTRGGSPFTRGMGEPDDGRYSTTEYIFAACGAAAMYRRSLFDTVGLFDEEFVSYYEDEDLSLRAQLAGFKCMYVPEAVCYHKRGATNNVVPLYPIRMQERNLTAFIIKNFPWQTILRKSLLIGGSRIRRVYREIRSGAGGPALRGLADGLRLVPSMLRKRRETQRIRAVPARYIDSLMEGVRGSPRRPGTS